jgi:DNA polymerase-3 subunit gamma/tau
VEIAASAHVFEQTKKISTRFLFIRAVRKLMKRFDPVLWGKDNTKTGKVRPAIEEIEEFLDTLAEQKDFSNNFPHKKLKKIVELCRKISGSVKTNNIPIDHIRRTIYWAHLSTSEKNKIIIIDNADQMFDSSRNSLLKLLEEPPDNVFIILLTTRKGAIIKTILSRLRPYHFPQRTERETGEILSKIFKDNSGEFQSLREYFLSWNNMNPGLLKSSAHKFIEVLLSPGRNELDILEEMEELLNAGPVRTTMISFAEELTFLLQKVLHNIYFENVAFEEIEEWAGILRQSMREFELLNLNAKNMIQSLFFKMKAVI